MANTILQAIELLFGCWHRNLSRPFTLSGWTYEVCLNRGKKLAYDRADIACVDARRKNLGRGESLQEGSTTISFVPAQGRERVKVAQDRRGTGESRVAGSHASVGLLFCVSRQ